MPQQILHTVRITLVSLADGHLEWEAELGRRSGRAMARTREDLWIEGSPHPPRDDHGDGAWSRAGLIANRPLLIARTRAHARHMVVSHL